MSQLIDNLNTIESIKTDIKAAIENKGVDMTGVSFPGYASKIGEISGGGGWDQKDITEKSYEIINLDNSASFVASSAFMNNTTIKTVNLPYATKVYDFAFYACGLLSQVNLPMCSILYSYAFGYCYSLTQVSLPVCSIISDYAFQNCSLLTQVSLPMCSIISQAAFRSCRLTQANLPMCSYIDLNGFQYCYSLSQVSLPVCSYIGDNAFNYCSPLSQVSLPVCSIIKGYAFKYCSSLSIITIGYSSVCNLINSMTFDHTQITSSTGSIYVPASLVDSYKSAKNWSYFSTQIFPIPE